MLQIATLLIALTLAAQSSHELGPGGFNYLPSRMHHQAWASDDALVFITVDAGWDVNWVSGPPTRSDLGQPLPRR